MSNERIDITELEKRFQDGLNWDGMDTMDLIAELKRMYESEDRLLELLQVIEYKYDVPVKQIAAVMSI